MDRRAYLRTTGAALAVGTAGCLDAFAGGLSEEDYDIGMSQNAFLPDEYEVSVGETVVWGNNGSRGHTVTAYESALPEGAAFFASGDRTSTDAAREAWYDTGEGDIAPGETFSHTFEVAGEHHYFCIPHESGGMVGTIVVRE
ncbi:plastocyanin/azurin family copper-binding protein [Natronomonas amylolytica]|uniref:plastocyanin/azurin family copper-binding protein n=1 Tax=Natronomonas amylolytica TaxID=3108498 RepID=UPI0030094621